MWELVTSSIIEYTSPGSFKLPICLESEPLQKAVEEGLKEKKNPSSNLDGICPWDLRNSKLVTCVYNLLRRSLKANKHRNWATETVH